MRHFLLSSIALFATAQAVEAGAAAPPVKMTGKQKKAAEEAAKKAGAKAETKKPSQEIVVPVIKKSALSTDVGPRVVAGLAKSLQDETAANEMLEGVKRKRYDLLADTTAAIIKAVSVDDSIDLSPVFKTADKAGMNKLNGQLGLVLGLRTVDEYGPPNARKRRLIWSPAVSSYFPQPGDPKEAPETKAKNTLRTNFTHMLKKCAQAAAGMIEEDIKFKKDKNSGTLLISGPAVQKKFGAKEVLLDEKQIVKPKNGKEDAVELKEKPSFTALAAMGAANHGAFVKRGSTSRGTGKGVVMDPTKAIVELCATFSKALDNIKGKPTEKQAEALEKVYDKIDALLNK